MKKNKQRLKDSRIWVPILVVLISSVFGPIIVNKIKDLSRYLSF